MHAERSAVLQVLPPAGIRSDAITVFGRGDVFQLGTVEGHRNRQTFTLGAGHGSGGVHGRSTGMHYVLVPVGTCGELQRQVGDDAVTTLGLVHLG